mmetsp:Transcript_10271/g.15552  ORF Transcript_10271/g.15552 Transcript_10271/m.15552 type:complete len:472 (+) Transcript_10271:108-1523(+)
MTFMAGKTNSTMSFVSDEVPRLEESIEGKNNEGKRKSVLKDPTTQSSEEKEVPQSKVKTPKELCQNQATHFEEQIPFVVQGDNGALLEQISPDHLQKHLQQVQQHQIMIQHQAPREIITIAPEKGGILYPYHAYPPHQHTMSLNLSPSQQIPGCIQPPRPHPPLSIIPQGNIPDQRVGQWTREEEAYATQIGNLFRSGKIPNCPEGITMRALLSNLLNCAPMRVTKKYSGENAIGKRSYRHDHTVSNEERQQICEELRRLEQEFHNSVCGTGNLKMSLLGTSHFPTPLSASAIEATSMPTRNERFFHTQRHDDMLHPISSSISTTQREKRLHPDSSSSLDQSKRMRFYHPSTPPIQATTLYHPLPPQQYAFYHPQQLISDPSCVAQLPTAARSPPQQHLNNNAPINHSAVMLPPRAYPHHTSFHTHQQMAVFHGSNGEIFYEPIVQQAKIETQQQFYFPQQQQQQQQNRRK